MTPTIQLLQKCLKDAQVYADDLAAKLQKEQEKIDSYTRDIKILEENENRTDK